jgi:hypothetical protein
MKRVILFLFALSTFAIAGMPPAKGCGPTEQAWAVKSRTADYSVPSPQDGKAVLVYLNHAAIGYYNQVKVGVDGQWKAATARHSYAAFQVEPGEHSLCAQTAHEFKVWIPVKIEAGRTYFVAENYPSPLGRPQLEIIDEANGKAQIANLKLAVSHPKN